MKKSKGGMSQMTFENGGTFGSVMMATDTIHKRFDNSPNLSDHPISGVEASKENKFLSMAFDLGRKITPEDEERIWAAIESQE